MGTQFSGTNLSEFDAGGDGQDDLFNTLSHPRRRFMFHLLQTAETPVGVEELTTELVAWEAQRSTPNRSNGSRDAIETSLVHNHLPMMDQAGLVMYDVTGQTVALGNRADEVRAHLQTMASY